LSGQAATDHLRSELGLFLKAKRKLLQPADFGLPVTGKRRSSGLRREEVAELAQVGFTWYTWLEQGRNIRASDRVLQRLAALFELNELETRLFRDLAGHPETSSGADSREASQQLQEVVDGIRFPTCVRNARYDVLAWNATFAEFFDFRHGEPELRKNLLWRLFANDWSSIELPEWQILARALTAEFRKTYSKSEMPSAYLPLVSVLCEESPLFKMWWDAFFVGDLTPIPVTIVQPADGRRVWTLHHFGVAGSDDLTLMLLTPESRS
jgi:transcriptional regulator with XRE-family HTH domain